uniref:Uncharacterized protein n=1 Tax=Pelusios castaneus TaxID=367368 RepID=A0A8C8SP94_9SAUR
MGQILLQLKSEAKLPVTQWGFNPKWSPSYKLRELNGVMITPHPILLMRLILTFHAGSGKLFYSSCNVALDLCRKNVINCHFEYRSDQIQATVSMVFERATESMYTFTVANIPVVKMDNLKRRECFRKHVSNAGSFPCVNKLRQDDLTEVTENCISSCSKDCYKPWLRFQ